MFLLGNFAALAGVSSLAHLISSVLLASYPPLSESQVSSVLKTFEAIAMKRIHYHMKNR